MKPREGAAGSHGYESLLDIEQVRLLYGGLLVVVVANVAAAALLAAVLWDAVDGARVIGWLLLVLAVQSVRLELLRRQRRPSGASAVAAGVWLWRFRWLSVASGVVWGAGGVVLFPAGDATLQLLMALTFAGISAGAISSVATDRIALLGYLMPALLPTALRFVAHGESLTTTVALMGLLFSAFIIVSSRRLQRQMCENVQLRAQAAEQEAVLRQEQQLNAIIGRVQSHFIRDADRRHAFDTLLEDLLSLTGSAYGFIAEVLRTPEGQPYLKSYAITNIAWSVETRAFYDAEAIKGLEFRNLRSLFGAALTTGEPVIANAPATDPRSGGLPPGHPPLHAFLGVPIRHGGKMIAMIGLANRPGGYDRTMIEFLHPLLATLGQLVDAERVERRHRQDQIELARLSRVASETTNGVIITDPQGRVEWINEGFTRITGYTLQEMQGRKPGELLQGPETDLNTVARMRDALQRQEPFELEIVNYTRSGQAYWMHISCNPLRDSAGQVQGFMAIESDVSERKRLEGIKGEFVSTVSHELRTPLTAIAGALGLLSGGVLGQMPPQVQEMVDMAQKNSIRLTTLINDLLDMEKLEAGQMRFDLVTQELGPLVRQSVQENQAYAHRHGVRIECLECPAGVIAAVDGQRFLQVMANLLSNAAKFSPPDAVVEVVLQQRPGVARLEVRDHGCGIAEAFQPHVFDRFSQADATNTRQKGGTGLGLSIARELVIAMGGQIGFESVPGQGTTFHVELPTVAMATPPGVSWGAGS